MTSGVRTPLPVSRFGAGLSTYSGRGMLAGTGRRGVWTPGVNGARWDMAPPYDPRGRGGREPGQNSTVAYRPTWLNPMRR
ncbi:hypothetical protein GCM10017786_75110 [Amycolatopsis deserti]|uniref:Uncharacterized protein n=1 Tax=Amycolatopsis deserti TaxID=185696 RepID=A0ABQ3JKG7_9PSEU|nr:hypothetical protein GCM10017786_75110 [Amycolatopsis deserti]